MPRFFRAVKSPAYAAWRAALAALAATLTLLAAPDPQALQRELVTRFGPARVSLLKDWLQMLNQARSQGSDDAKLRRVNDFVNRNINFESDISVWQQSDYWATPIETIGQGRGDCEDFAILKYVSLRQAGVQDSHLRLIYVKARLQTPVGPQVQTHGPRLLRDAQRRTAGPRQPQSGDPARR